MSLPTNPLETITPTHDYPESGLTKREYFAAMAMQGIVGNGHLIDSFVNGGREWVAKQAVQVADALIKALNEPVA